jgi:hypothetical protein
MAERQERKGKRHRGHNEGSVYRRGNGWSGAISLGYEGGRLKRKQVYGKTKDEVLSKLETERKKAKEE